MILCCVKNTGQPIFLVKDVNDLLVIDQSMHPVNLGRHRYRSYHNQQFLLKEKSMIEMYRLSRERSERKEKINIGSWDDLKIYCKSLDLLCDLSNDFIKLYYIEGMPPSIIYSIFINGELTLFLFKRLWLYIIITCIKIV